MKEMLDEGKENDFLLSNFFTSCTKSKITKKKGQQQLLN